MEHKSILQILLILASIALIFIYVKPAFDRISMIQDEIFEYKTVVVNAQKANTLLTQLIQKEKSFSPQDMIALEKFLPYQIDDIQIMRDVESIFEDYGLKVELQTFETENSDSTISSNNDNESSNFRYQDFTLSLVGNYDDIKKVLVILEKNSYPLEVIELSVSEHATSDLGSSVAPESQELNISMTIRVYALLNN